MQVAATSSAVMVPCASTRVASSRSSLGSIAGLTPVFRTRQSRRAVTVRAEKPQVSVCLAKNARRSIEWIYCEDLEALGSNVSMHAKHASIRLLNIYSVVYIDMSL